MPGYEVKFTGPLDKAFECPICLIALREPVQITPCGHRMCSTCLQPILRYDDQNITSPRICSNKFLSMRMYIL